jgi:hypothetical protein
LSIELASIAETRALLVVYTTLKAGDKSNSHMELVQKQGKRWDQLKIEGRRIEHKWDLGRESGTRSTALANLDPHIGCQVKKTEGRTPYLILAAMVAALMLLATQGNAINPLVWGLLPTLFVVLLVAALRTKSKQALSIISLKDGSLFAVIRHDWVEGAQREAFLEALRGLQK